MVTFSTKIRLYSKIFRSLNLYLLLMLSLNPRQINYLSCLFKIKNTGYIELKSKIAFGVEFIIN